MRPALIGLIGTALAGVLLALASTAHAKNIYKYSDANGRIVYTDDPSAANGAAERVDIPPQPEAPPAMPRSETERRLLEQASQRISALDRAVQDIAARHDALRAAEARRERGIEPLEGERAGRRFRPEYWERQQTLEREVETARARLDEAFARRNALR